MRAFCLFFRRRRQKSIAPMSTAKATNAPSTIPAIAPLPIRFVFRLNRPGILVADIVGRVEDESVLEVLDEVRAVVAGKRMMTGVANTIGT